MSDMRARWIDLKFFHYINILFTIFTTYISFNIKNYNDYIKLSSFSLNYNMILNFKDFILLKYQTLHDLTAVNYPEFHKSLELNYFFWSYKLSSRFILKYFLNKEDLIISLINIYSNANWLEREVWDLYGIKFIYHIDLRRILTDYGFIGHPLLKLFPLIGFFELRYDDLLEKILKENLELTQAYRFFIYFNPWMDIHSNKNINN